MKITRRFEFDAAHRLMGYDGPCSNIHGHHYVAEITVEGYDDTLDSMGMLIDFKHLKAIGDWIDAKWDHALLLNPDDKMVIPTRIYYMFERNPTAENMAMELCYHAKKILEVEDVKVVNVRLYETPDCFVDYSP